MYSVMMIIVVNIIVLTFKDLSFQPFLKNRLKAT